MDQTLETGNNNQAKSSALRDGPKYDHIRDFLEAHRGESHVVVVHDFPDPDAISSAFAHRLVCSQYDIETSIIYLGKISHQQNVALIRLLGIEPMLFSSDLVLSQFHGAVFIDNQGANCKDIVDALESAGVPALAMVDHHDRQDRLTAEFSDIRRVGATATLYAGYLEQGLVQLDRNNQVHVAIATALMHGLISDTQGFIRANEKDFFAAAYLSQFQDANLLLQIMSQTRSKTIMEIIQLALGNRVLVENFSITGIGYLRAEDRDAIPQAADFLLTEENVHTAIVYGIVTGNDFEEKLIGSLRTTKVTLGPDEFLKEVFSKAADGHYYGGGKELAGGFEIPIGFLGGENNDDYRQLKWQVYDYQIKQKLFAKIGVKQIPGDGSLTAIEEHSTMAPRRPGRAATAASGS